jgi:parvulin-like peptidyl-prolyl isomerase
MSQRRRDTLPKKRSGAAGPASQRRISRREREERQRRQLYIGLAIAGVLSLVILAGFALNEYFLKPRAVLASVNGVEIRRRDYWKVRSVELVNQVNQYNQFSQLVDPSQQQQYLTLAQQAASELDKVWGSTDINDSTLTRMVEDQVYLQSLDDMGLSVTDQDVQNYLWQQFEPQNAPIFTPTPSPTLIPQRAEWATQTEVALQAENQTPTPVSSVGSPAAGGGTPIAGQATPIGSPVAGTPIGSPVAGTPAASPISGTPIVIVIPSTAASPVAQASPSGSAATPVAVQGTPGTLVGTPAASPVGSPVNQATPITQESATPEAATPNPTEAIATSEASYGNYKSAVFDIAHMSDSDYENLIVRPAIAREKIEGQLLKDVGQTAPQVHAAHILVDTKDLADSIYAELQGGANFEETARQQSNDTSTAENGGDLGWFTRGQMVKPFEDVAFSLQPGQISQPFQTQYGWHIVKVYEVDQNRPMTDQQLQQYRDSIVSRWLEEQKTGMDISSKVEPTPTPAVSSFVPPPDAPPLPTETPLPPEASPVTESGTPTEEQASPIGSPVASPIASPMASPVGSPNASPVASPIASPTAMASATATP